MTLELTDVDVVEAGLGRDGTSARRPSRRLSVSRVRAKRVCSARSKGTLRELRRQRGGRDAARGVQRHRNTRVAVEQAEAVVDRARVADEGVAAQMSTHVLDMAACPVITPRLRFRAGAGQLLRTIARLTSH